MRGVGYRVATDSGCAAVNLLLQRVRADRFNLLVSSFQTL